MKSSLIPGKWVVAILLVFSVLVFSCGSEKKNNTQIKNKPVDTASYAFKEAELNKQIQASPNDAALYNKRAQLHLRFGDFQKALNDASRATNIDSTNVEYIYTLGDVYGSALRMDKAMLHYEKVLQKDKGHAKTHLKMAKICMYMDRMRDAMNHINAALKTDEHMAEAYFLKGSVYELLGDSAKAATSFQTAVEQKATYYDAYISLGLLYAAAKNDLALEYFKTALTLNPGSIEALYNIAMYYQDTDRFDDAIRAYRQILAIDKNHEVSYHNIGYIYLVKLNDYATAITKFDTAIYINPSYIGAIHNRGLAYEELGDYKKARADFKMALIINPQFDLSAKELDRMDRLGLK